MPLPPSVGEAREEREEWRRSAHADIMAQFEALWDEHGDERARWDAREKEWKERWDAWEDAWEEAWDASICLLQHSVMALAKAAFAMFVLLCLDVLAMFASVCTLVRNRGLASNLLLPMDL